MIRFAVEIFYMHSRRLTEFGKQKSLLDEYQNSTVERTCDSNLEPNKQRNKTSDKPRPWHPKHEIVSAVFENSHEWTVWGRRFEVSALGSLTGGFEVVKPWAFGCLYFLLLLPVFWKR